MKKTNRCFGAEPRCESEFRDYGNTHFENAGESVWVQRSRGTVINLPAELAAKLRAAPYVIDPVALEVVYLASGMRKSSWQNVRQDVATPSWFMRQQRPRIVLPCVLRPLHS